MNLSEELLALHEMSLDDAKSILDIDSSKDIDKAYRKMALKHHPDREGGSDEMMKKVNNAYELLKSSSVSGVRGSMSSDEQRAEMKRYREESDKRKASNKIKMETMLKDFAERFKGVIPKYNAHFEEFFSLEKPEFTSKVTGGYSENWNGFISIKWTTPDGATEIRFRVDISPDQSGGLTYGTEPTYKVTYDTSFYHARKSHKMSLRSYQWGKTSNETLDPESVFPKAKLKKILKKKPTDKMTPKAFRLAIVSELKKWISKRKFRNDYYAFFDFEREDRLVFALDRRVWDRKPTWNLEYLVKPEGWEDMKKIFLQYVSKTELPKELQDVAYELSWPESSKGLDKVKELLPLLLKSKKIPKDFFKASWDAMYPPKSKTLSEELLRMHE